MKTQTIKLAGLTIVGALMLTACGDTVGDRALSGGAIGAGAGAVGGAIVGGDPLTGAVVGGAVGAAAGGLTDKNDVNLGRPVWRK